MQTNTKQRGKAARRQKDPAETVGAVLIADCGKLGEAGARIRITEKHREKLVAQGKARNERPTDRGIFGFGI